MQTILSEIPVTTQENVTQTEVHNVNESHILFTRNGITMVHTEIEITIKIQSIVTSSGIFLRKTILELFSQKIMKVGF